MKYAAYALLALLYVVHTDIWLWNDPSLIFGLPVGLAFHIGFIVATSLVLWLAVTHAWPAGLDAEGEDERS